MNNNFKIGDEVTIDIPGLKICGARAIITRTSDMFRVAGFVGARFVEDVSFIEKGGRAVWPAGRESYLRIANIREEAS